MIKTSFRYDDILSILNSNKLVIRHNVIGNNIGNIFQKIYGMNNVLNLLFNFVLYICSVKLFEPFNRKYPDIFSR